MRRKLRCILWRQWKKPRTRLKKLRQLGLDVDRTKASAYNGRGPWWNAGASHMNQAIPTRMLRRWGLVSFRDEMPVRDARRAPPRDRPAPRRCVLTVKANAHRVLVQPPEPDPEALRGGDDHRPKRSAPIGDEEPIQRPVQRLRRAKNPGQGGTASRPESGFSARRRDSARRPSLRQRAAGGGGAEIRLLAAVPDRKSGDLVCRHFPDLLATQPLES